MQCSQPGLPAEAGTHSAGAEARAGFPSRARPGRAPRAALALTLARHVCARDGAGQDAGREAGRAEELAGRLAGQGGWRVPEEPPERAQRCSPGEAASARPGTALLRRRLRPGQRAGKLLPASALPSRQPRSPGEKHRLQALPSSPARAQGGLDGNGIAQRTWLTPTPSP